MVGSVGPEFGRTQIAPICTTPTISRSPPTGAQSVRVRLGRRDRLPSCRAGAAMCSRLGTPSRGVILLAQRGLCAARLVLPCPGTRGWGEQIGPGCGVGEPSAASSKPAPPIIPGHRFRHPVRQMSPAVDQGEHTAA